MFRIVVKSNLTMSLAHNLKEQFEFTLPTLDSMQDGYASMHSAKQVFAMSMATGGVVGGSFLSSATSSAVDAAANVINPVKAVKSALKWSGSGTKVRFKSAREKLLGVDLAMLEEAAEEGVGKTGAAAKDASAAYRRRIQSYRHKSMHQVC